MSHVSYSYVLVDLSDTAEAECMNVRQYNFNLSSLALNYELFSVPKAFRAKL